MEGLNSEKPKSNEKRSHLLFPAVNDLYRSIKYAPHKPIKNGSFYCLIDYVPAIYALFESAIYKKLDFTS